MGRADILKVASARYGTGVRPQGGNHRAHRKMADKGQKCYYGFLAFDASDGAYPDWQFSTNRCKGAARH